jgi:transcriptional regulator with GAF, ATPase, and Fis domain
LLEAEFFGVAPGAFTGADRKGRVGKFKLADGGTLFLDEIGDMPLSLQPKLLRALQEGEIEALGSNKVISFDARVMAATSRDLPALVREGKFREDLFYRLNVLPIRVPPLRERSNDIPALVEVLAEDMALRNGSAPPELSAQAIALLSAQSWRGNIRELRNVLEQAAMRSDTQHIEVKHLEEVLRESGVQPIGRGVPAGPTALSASASQALRPLAEQVAELERGAINSAMAATGGNKVAAAKLLGISRAKLYERLEIMSESQSMTELQTGKMTRSQAISRIREKKSL